MPVPPIPKRPLILVVDDEPDIHAITRLTLRGLRHGGHPVRFLSASSGNEALVLLHEHPDVAVILLDVVMEREHAGLDVCASIRHQLNNPFVRILLRTGQPGSAPEKETIDAYDIDGYLPKAELTKSRLYVAVRTALRAWSQLVALEQHRQGLATLNACVADLQADCALEDCLDRILESANDLCSAPLIVAVLEIRAAVEGRRRFFRHRAEGDALAQAEAESDALAGRIERLVAEGDTQPLACAEGGLLTPIRLHRELGRGWIFWKDTHPSPIAERMLPLLAEHAGNALYASAAQRILAEDAPLFSDVSI